MRTNIWLVRHGQTALNKAQRYQGQIESPLTSYGERQCEILARRLRRLPFEHAYVSPSERTRATAEAILASRPTSVVVDPRWSETNHGCWEGLTYQEVCERFPGQAEARFADRLHGRAVGGESIGEVAERVAAAWAAILQDHQRGHVLIVTHATPIQLLLCQLNGLSPALHWRWRIDLGSVTALNMYASGPIIRLVNEVPR